MKRFWQINVNEKGLIRYLRSSHAQLVQSQRNDYYVFDLFGVRKMTNNFCTYSKSAKWLLRFWLVWSKQTDYQLFYLFKVSGLKQNYYYSVSDVSSNSDSDSDSSSVSMNLVIFAFFILYLDSSKKTCG